ncbi:MAG: hypothetical protein H8E66_07560 [Planctomycetes bacterium]|nr:hypothetical protein [Planctomycetota bacterium]
MRDRTTTLLRSCYLGGQLTIMPVHQNHLGQLLFEAGWLPTPAQIASPTSHDLLPIIQAVWKSCARKSLAANKRRQAERMRDWIDQQVANGAQLADLDADGSQTRHWLGERLAWWPRGRPEGSRIGIASSRLGRRVDTQADWFTVFRAACSQINRGQDVLLTAIDTTPDRYVQRAAELFDVRVVSVSCPRESMSVRSWLQSIRQRDSNPTEAIYRVYVSPETHCSLVDREKPLTLQNVPVRDRVVVSMADRVLVFQLRRGGQLEKLVRARIEDSVWQSASVFIAIGQDLVERELAHDLLDRGAVGWVVLNTLYHEELPRSESPLYTRAPIIELPSCDNWKWLTHCTRAQPDGWPDQPQSDYFGELLLSRPATDHSAFAAVQRIAAIQRLVATSRMIRGEVDAVCFTAVPLNDLPQLRSFRSHLGRWDFEPYGICIRRDWLQQQRCSPVRYGDDSLWESLAEEERPFFQVSASHSHQRGRAIDWTVEDEWRHVGDLDLRKLPREAGIVFVPTREEAERLAAISRWPVTILAS